MIQFPLRTFRFKQLDGSDGPIKTADWHLRFWNQCFIFFNFYGNMFVIPSPGSRETILYWLARWKMFICKLQQQSG